MRQLSQNGPMYLQHFQLSETPFSITPDPRFVYLSARHRDGLAHLLYGLGQGGSGGFVVLTGEVGTGKTTLCRLALEQLPEQTLVALVLNPKLNPIELLETIAEELQLDVSAARGSQKQLVDLLNQKLLASHADGKRVVLMLDEAQNLSLDALEQVRLLTNLETAKQKLLQIILLGQPELNALLERDDLRQLAQRITARFHLTPLNKAECKAYLEHRLMVAGSTHQLFDRSAFDKIYRASKGIPRVINVLADHSLMAAFAQGASSVRAKQVTLAISEVLPAYARKQRQVFYFGLISALLGAFLLTLFWLASKQALPETVPETLPETALASQPNTSANQSSEPSPWVWLLREHGLPATDDMQAALRQCRTQLSAEKRCLHGKANAKYLTKLQVPYLRKKPDGSWSNIPAEANYVGEFYAIYDLPAEVPTAFAAGYAGPGVSLLAERLAKIDGGSANQRIYGPRMTERVRKLQNDLEIPTDGVVGPATWLALSPELDRQRGLAR